MWLDKKVCAALLPEQTAPAMTQGLRHVAIRKMLIPDLCTVSYSLQTPGFFHPCTSFLQVNLSFLFALEMYQPFVSKYQLEHRKKIPIQNLCEIIMGVQ